MNRLTKLTFVLLSALMPSVIFAQEESVDVDPYTGTGAVSIPIFNSVLDGLNTGISLQYTTKGILIDQMSSSIGLGFNLQAGGSIIRSVQGIEDEVTFPFVFKKDTNDHLQGFAVPNAHNLFIGLVQDSVEDETESDIFMVNAVGRIFSFAFRRNPTTGNTELITQPSDKVSVEVYRHDIDPVTGNFYNFAYNIGDSMGLDSLHGILRFIVHDEMGNTFVFDRGDYRHKEMDIDTNIFKSHATTCLYYPTEKWDLVQLITYTGKVIKYEYQRTYVEYAIGTREMVNTKEFDFFDPYPDTGRLELRYDPMEINDDTWKGIKTHLSKINFPNGTKAIFDLSTDSMARCDCQKDFRLRSINIESGDNNYKNYYRYKFKQQYFVAPNWGAQVSGFVFFDNNCSIYTNALTAIPYGKNIDSAKRMHLSRGLRLKLMAIERVNESNTQYQPYYTFEYNSLPLPYRLSPQKDWYGYYNNGVNHVFVRDNPEAHLNGPVMYNDSMHLSIPYHREHPLTSYPGTFMSTKTEYWGQERTPSHAHMQADILTTVSNRMGGKIRLHYTDYILSLPDSAYRTKFYTLQGWFYEYPIDLDTNLQGINANDGLVVDSVIYENNFSVLDNRKIVYTYANGQRFNPGGYMWYLDIYGKKIHTNTFVGEMDFFSGSNHGFSNVQVREFSKTDLISDTRYTFSNLTYKDSNNKTETNIFRPTGAGFQRASTYLNKTRMGQTLKLETYDENGFKKSEILNEYEYVNSDKKVENIKNYALGTAAYNEPYPMLDNNFSRVIKTTATSFRGSISSTDTVNYIYDGYNNSKSMSWKDSKGSRFKKYTLYAYDYNSRYAFNSAVKSKHLLTSQYKFSDEVWKFTSPMDSSLIEFNMATPLVVNNKVRFPVSFAFKSAEPLSGINANNSSYIDREKAVDFTTNSAFGVALKKIQALTKFDSLGNNTEIFVENQVHESKIFDHLGHQIAAASNTGHSGIAFTSFEGGSNYLVGADDAKGNWEFESTSLIFSSSSFTGKFYYNMNYEMEMKSALLTPTKYYVLSFWSKTALVGFTGDPTIYKPKVSLHNMMGVQQQILTPAVANVVGPWTLYTIKFQAGSTLNAFNYISISNSYYHSFGSVQIHIDEARLHPADAAMDTYTYEPLYGVSSHTDNANVVTYYEYDSFGNKIITRDMRGYILKKMVYGFTTSDSENTGQSSGGGSND